MGGVDREGLSAAPFLPIEFCPCVCEVPTLLYRPSDVEARDLIYLAVGVIILFADQEWSRTFGP